MCSLDSIRKRKESFNTSFGIATYGAVESPKPFIVSFGHVEKSSDTCMCGVGKSKRPRNDQKWRCSGAERKAMVRGEYRTLSADPRPRACVVSMEELPGVPNRAGGDFPTNL